MSHTLLLADGQEYYIASCFDDYDAMRRVSVIMRRTTKLLPWRRVEVKRKTEKKKKIPLKGMGDDNYYSRLPFPN